MRIVEIVEIDFPRCLLTYGNAPCAAALGVTGAIKCFNTARTCQDRTNYDEGTETIRFIDASSDPDDYDAIPSLQSISITPAIIEPGLSLGQRETAQVVFRDHRDSDVLTDPYYAERSYDPFDLGTFWGKIRARLPSLRGATMRIYRGENGDDLADMDSWTYVIETAQGPAGGRFTIKAKDPLKFLDGDRAQAPAVTPGILADAIDDQDGPVNLSPSGVGDAYYPTSGYVAIGGSEICSFTRVGDVMTLTRGQEGTDAQDHDQFEGVQLVLVYSGESPADIVYDLLTEYTDINPLWIPISDWQNEMSLYINRLYSAKIAEPTPVKKLINELIEQVGLVMWADLKAERINMTALRPVPATASLYTEDRILNGSFSTKEQLEKRVSQVWTYIGLRNPLADLTDRSNYQSVVVSLDETGADEEYGNLPAIKKVFSRWITTTNRSAASRLNSLLLSRYRDPPRRIGYSLFRSDAPPGLGRGAQVNHFDLQGATGQSENVSTQVVSLEATDDRFEIMAEELDFSIEDDEKIIFIDQNDININLRELYDELFGPPTTYDKITFVIESGVYVGTPWRDYNGAVEADAAILDNPDFEEGDTGWTFFGAGSHAIAENGTVYNGTWGGSLGLTSNPNSSSGIFVNDSRTAISPGDGAAFKLKVRSPGGWGALEDAPWIRVRIYWYDASLVFLSSTDGDVVYGYDCLNEWNEARVVGVAPSGAAYFTMAIQAAYGDGGFYFDQAENLDDELYAVHVGAWPEGPDLCLINNGEIRAGGGRGGHGPDEFDQNGIDGATGIYTRYPIEIQNNGVIAGGGGGGGGWEDSLQAGGGGGGAGYSEDALGNQTFAPGGDGFYPGTDGESGTVETGGAGFDLAGSFTNDGGDGGEDGETPSSAGAYGNGGSAGNAVDGDSYVTFAVLGTVLGPRVN